MAERGLRVPISSLAALIPLMASSSWISLFPVSTDSIFHNSHNRRQQVKKVPHRNTSLDANYPPRKDEVIKNSNGADFGNSDLFVETKSRVDGGCNSRGEGKGRGGVGAVTGPRNSSCLVIENSICPAGSKTRPTALISDQTDFIWSGPV